MDVQEYKLKNQYFTPDETIAKCMNLFTELLHSHGENLEDFTIIEPSAGSGNWLKWLPKTTIALDIEPRNKKIIKQNFYDYPGHTKSICIGNPPFGKRGEEALKFINHCATFADYVAFILPPFFGSDGKGTPRKRVKNLNLILSEKIPSKFFFPNGKKVIVQTIFQVWSRFRNDPDYEIKPRNSEDFKIFSVSLKPVKRNANKINLCKYFLPSTCFGEKNMKLYTSFDDLPQQRGYGIIFKSWKYEKKFFNINWGEISYLSTNNTHNIRKSLIYDALIN